MPILWPLTLPQVPLLGYREQFPNLAIETQMDTGPPKARRRFTAGVRPLPAHEMVLTAAQAATLDTFYTDTTAGGTLPFDWLHPRTGAAITVRFSLPPPELTRLSTDRVLVRFALKILP